MFPSGNSIHKTYFSFSEEFLGVVSLTRVLSASHEKAFRGVSASHGNFPPPSRNDYEDFPPPTSSSEQFSQVVLRTSVLKKTEGETSPKESSTRGRGDVDASSQVTEPVAAGPYGLSRCRGLARLRPGIPGTRSGERQALDCRRTRRWRLRASCRATAGGGGGREPSCCATSRRLRAPPS
jgi:hypothetical protein